MAFPGTIVKDFPPHEGNLRNSEGSFITLTNGDIVFAFSRYRNDKHDCAICDLAYTVSKDDGKTWSEEKIFLVADGEDAQNYMSVSLLSMQDGTVGVFYLKKKRGYYSQYCLRRTADFVTFGDEEICLKHRSYTVVNNDRVRRLSNGAIIIPSAFYSLDGLPEGASHGEGPKFYLPPAEARFYISYNDGKSFSLLSRTAMPHAIFSDYGLEEPGVEELANGVLYAYYRNSSGRQYESYSHDGGKHFSTPAPSRFTSPQSPMSMRRLSDGRFVIVHNPIPNYPGRMQERESLPLSAGRTPYVLVTADGNLTTFGETRYIETDPDAGFCYCAIYETEDAVLFGYCAGGVEDVGTLNRCRIRRIEKCDI